MAARAGALLTAMLGVQCSSSPPLKTHCHACGKSTTLQQSIIESSLLPRDHALIGVSANHMASSNGILQVHHGDGVEEAFLTTDRVMTVSLHKFGLHTGRGGEGF